MFVHLSYRVKQRVNNLHYFHYSIRLQQEGCSHVVPRGGEDYRGGDQEQRTNCNGGEVRDDGVFQCVVYT